MRHALAALAAILTLSACDAEEIDQRGEAAPEIMAALEDARLSGECGGDVYDGMPEPNAPDADVQEIAEIAVWLMVEEGWSDRDLFDHLSIELSIPNIADLPTVIDWYGTAEDLLDDKCHTIMRDSTAPAAAATYDGAILVIFDY